MTFGEEHIPGLQRTDLQTTSGNGALGWTLCAKTEFEPVRVQGLGLRVYVAGVRQGSVCLAWGGLGLFKVGGLGPLTLNQSSCSTRASGLVLRGL